MQQPDALEGGVFHPNIPHGRSSGVFTIAANTLHIHTHTQQSFDIPLHEAELSIGGHKQKTLFCSHPTQNLTLFADVTLFLPWLQTHASHALAAALEQCARTQATHSRKHTTLFAYALLCLLLLGWGLHACSKQGTHTLAQYVPTSVDKEIGALAYDMMLEDAHVITDPVVQKSMQDILQRIAPKTHTSFKIAVVKDKKVNAFALPGGYIVVFSQLIEEASSPEWVAAVLAHETAHVTQRHSVQQWIQSLGVVGVAQVMLGDVVGLLAFVKELVSSVALSHYSQSHENDADAHAIQTLYKASINPSALSDFFTYMEQKHPPQEASNSALRKTLKHLQTHPEMLERIRTVRTQCNTLKPIAYKPLDIDWKAVQKAVKE
jgi:Zn-dependent protease with chaperone function